MYSQVDGALLLKFNFADIVFFQSSLKEINNHLNLLDSVKDTLGYLINRNATAHCVGSDIF